MDTQRVSSDVLNSCCSVTVNRHRATCLKELTGAICTEVFFFFYELPALLADVPVNITNMMNHLPFLQVR
jgi:hypothetical protein